MERLPGSVLAGTRLYQAPDALLARRTYATTGARMRLRFRVGEHRMGEVVRVASDSPLAAAREIAT